MCQFASFKFRPCDNVPVLVANLNSHGETEKALNLPPDTGPDGWHDGHYLPDGTVACRGVDGDTLTPGQCQSAIRARWPRFVDFLAWALAQEGVATIGGSLYLGDLTDAKGLVLPKTIGGLLDLGGLTDAKGLVLPKTIGGSLDLGGLTDAKGLVLPKTIGGSLYLGGKSVRHMIRSKP